MACYCDAFVTVGNTKVRVMTRYGFPFAVYSADTHRGLPCGRIYDPSGTEIDIPSLPRRKKKFMKRVIRELVKRGLIHKATFGPFRYGWRLTRCNGCDA